MRRLILVLSFLAGLSAHGQLDDVSRNALIDKLQRVQVELAVKDPSKVPVTLRLGDLLSERARLAALKENEQGCTDCKAGLKDRARALALYKEVLDQVTPAQKGRVLIQIGHLLQLQGRESDAVSYYSKVGDDVEPVMKAEAQLSMAEILFRQRSFQKAQSYYREVMKIEGAASKGLAAYRLAWCSYNLGQIEEAKSQLISMLRTPSLLNRQGSSGGVDKAFKEEVSIDLASFMAQAQLRESDLKTLQELSPEAAKISNLNAVAAEAGRIGKKNESLMAWMFVQELITDPSQRFNAWVNISQLNLDLGKKDEALAFLRKSLDLRAQLKECSGMCKETDARVRGLVISWNKIEKLSPSPALAEAYRLYQAQYDDAEMHFWSAAVHRELKMWDTAWTSAQAALQGATQNLKGAPDTKKIESILLYRLELAELAKKSEWLEQAQADYISLSKDQSKLAEVRYQKAQGAYDAGRYQEAGEQMREFALDKKMPAKLRKQAADLALDAAVLLKSDEKVLSWAKEFAGHFGGEEKKDFVQVQQKALLTRSAQLSESQPEAALAALAEFQMAEASPTDRVTYLKNKLLLSEKLKKFTQAKMTTDELLAQPNLTPADVEFALGKKAQFADLALDFNSSLKALEKMKMEKVSPDQRLLKLALYSQLAGVSPERYLKEYLTMSKPSATTAGVALELVKMAKDPSKEISSQHNILVTQPELLADAYLYAYSKNPSPALAQRILAEKVISGTALGKLFARQQVLKDYRALKGKIEAHALQTKTQRALTASIKARAALLEESEKFANRVIQSGDWTGQLLALQLVATQSDRFYQELLSLPMPSGLSEEEQNQYMTILSQQAAPYQAKAQEAKIKVGEFWAQTAWKDGYREALLKEGFRPLVKVELEALSEIAPEGGKAEIVALTSPAELKTSVGVVAPSLQAMEQARTKVRSEPFNVAALKELLELEKQAKNQAMVQYLEERIGGVNE